MLVLGTKQGAYQAFAAAEELKVAYAAVDLVYTQGEWATYSCRLPTIISTYLTPNVRTLLALGWL